MVSRRDWEGQWLRTKLRTGLAELEADGECLTSEHGASTVSVNPGNRTSPKGLQIPDSSMNDTRIGPVSSAQEFSKSWYLECANATKRAVGNPSYFEDN